MAYSEKVIDHYENPRNVGKLDKNADDVGTGMVGAPACEFDKYFYEKVWNNQKV